MYLNDVEDLGDLGRKKKGGIFKKFIDINKKAFMLPLKALQKVGKMFGGKKGAAGEEEGGAEGDTGAEGEAGSAGAGAGGKDNTMTYVAAGVGAVLIGGALIYVVKKRRG
jgi:LPXTG-motif cell wall-anchored protein